MARITPRGIVAAGVIGAVVVVALGWGDRSLSSRRTDPALSLEVRAAVPRDVMQTLKQACFDCHSDQTVWPWYSRMPPGSWVVGRDVDAGRRQLNFSAWGAYNPFDRADLLDKACDLVKKHRMPLWPYRLLHREARLTDDQIAALCEWADREATRLVNGGT